MHPTELSYAPHDYVSAAPYIVAWEHPHGRLVAQARNSLTEAVESLFWLGPKLTDEAGDRRWLLDARGLTLLAFDPTNPIPHRRVTITGQVVHLMHRLGLGDGEHFEAMEMLVIEREVLMEEQRP